jgi:UDP-N-acetylmuramyl pentapeptide phosphotransferase/UDP-N-acetylglucosamine-1-phosphate transferase
MNGAKKRSMFGLGETHARASARDGDTKPEQRFWIISMMLVLIGLSTLKLR